MWERHGDKKSQDGNCNDEKRKISLAFCADKVIWIVLEEITIHSTYFGFFSSAIGILKSKGKHKRFEKRRV